MKRVLRPLGLASAMVLAMSTLSAVAADTPTPTTGPLADAASYAKDYGVSLDQAKWRLALQADISSLDAEFSATESTYAGMWIDQSSFTVA